MKHLMVALMIAVVALAGCTGGGDDTDGTPTPTQTATQTSTTGTSTTQTSTGGSNEAPDPDLQVQGNSSGEAPLEVTFILDGSDADGDDLTFTFDADEDGTFEAEGSGSDFPVEVTFTYENVGQFRANLTLSDGQSSASGFQLVVVQDEAPTMEDRGEYFYEFATGHCHAKSYSWPGEDEGVPPTVVYTSGIGGGTWVFTEDNDVEGLQYEDNHPLTGTGVGFELPVDEDCTDGDLTAV